MVTGSCALARIADEAATTISTRPGIRFLPKCFIASLLFNDQQTSKSGVWVVSFPIDLKVIEHRNSRQFCLPFSGLLTIHTRCRRRQGATRACVYRPR